MIFVANPYARYFAWASTATEEFLGDVGAIGAGALSLRVGVPTGFGLGGLSTAATSMPDVTEGEFLLGDVGAFVSPASACCFKI